MNTRKKLTEQEQHTLSTILEISQEVINYCDNKNLHMMDMKFQYLFGAMKIINVLSTNLNYNILILDYIDKVFKYTINAISKQELEDYINYLNECYYMGV